MCQGQDSRAKGIGSETQEVASRRKQQEVQEAQVELTTGEGGKGWGTEMEERAQVRIAGHRG